MTETRVWIVQCLCPKRHCIVACAGEASSEDEARRTIQQPLRKALNDLIDTGTLNPWCGMCRASRATWKYEVARMQFTRLEDAQEMLRDSEANQVWTASQFGNKGALH